MTLKRLGRALTEPHPAIHDPEERHRARLLAALQLVIFSAVALTIAFTAVFGYPASSLVGRLLTRLGLVALAVSIVVYGLSRTRRYRLGAALGIGAVWVLVFAAMLAEPRESLLPAFLLLPVLGSSLFFSPRTTVFSLAVSLVGVLLYCWLTSGRPAWVNVVLVEYLLFVGALALAIAGVRQRDLGRVRQANDELEQRVAERTVQLQATASGQQATQDFLAHVLAASPAVIYVAEATGDYGSTFVSDNIVAQLGYQPHAFTDDPGFWASHIHPEDAPIVFAELPRLFEQGHLTCEYRFRHQDGGYRWMRDEMNLLRDADGVPREIIGSWFDITERKANEEALRRALAETAHSQHLLRALSQAAHTAQRARTPDEIYRAIGAEVVKLGWHVAIFTQTPDHGHLVVRYLTFAPAIVQAAERLAGLSLQDFRFAIVPGGIFDRILAARQTLFFERLTEPIAEVLPGPLHPVIGPLMALLKPERGIYAPLTVNAAAYGLLVVMGADLTEADAPAMAAFAGQIATALENVRLLQEMQARVAERETLLRELHHRVKNNLQIIASLLSMQARETPPADVLTMVAETRDRVRSMALIHEKLYRAVDLAQVDFCDYLESMARMLLQTYHTDPAAIILQFDCQGEATLDLNTAILCGLIANELVSNALKHAFPAGRGEITIAFHIAPAGRCTLSVADDGVALPPQALAGPGRGFGLRLVEMLAEQLGGRLAVQAAPVVKFEVTWPG